MRSILARWRDCFRTQFVDDYSQYPFLGSSGYPLTPSSIETIRPPGCLGSMPTCCATPSPPTTWSRKWATPLWLQQITGHRSLEIVRHYVVMASVQQDLLERRASPMDRFGGEHGGPRNARRVQPRRKRRLRLVR